MFVKRAFSNSLTKLIQKNPDVELETVLLHEDLSTTIRNESEVLYQRVLQKDDPSWFEELIDYAFFDKQPPKKFKKFNTVKQINKNAASFLKNCGQKFIQYFKENTKSKKNDDLIQPKKLQKILKAKIKFFFDDEENECFHDCLYAGNFQRFFENFVRLEAFDQQEEIENIFPQLIKNCRILAYQQLLTKILGDFKSQFENETIYKILTMMLQRSCAAVKCIRKSKKKKKEENALYISRKSNINQKVNKNNQPLNTNKESIPNVDFVFQKNNDIQDLNENSREEVTIPWKSKDRTKVSYESKEDAEIDAYLLLMSIRLSFFEQTDIVDLFRADEDNNYPLIQALFYCGTRCDVKSLISLESFRLLSIIFNGSKCLNIDKWKFLEEEKNEFDFYNSFAEEMIFDPNCLTYKMIHALPVFWNHRYNKNEYQMSKEEKEKANTEDYYKDGKNHFRKREKGETAFEILQPCVICEPPISSQLTFFYNDILVQLTTMRKDLFQDYSEKRTKAKADLMIKLDGVILDFYQHQFYFGSHSKKTSLTKLSQDFVIVPLAPTDKHYFNVEDEKRRAVLNGFVIDFFCRMTSIRVNFFFFIINDDNEKTVSDFGKASCFNVNFFFYEYKDYTSFELLDDNTLYNIVTNKEFCFDDDDLDEDDKNMPNETDDPYKYKLVIVDEMTNSNQSDKSVNNSDEINQTNKKKKIENSNLDDSTIQAIKKKIKKSVDDNENKQTSKNTKTKEDSNSDDDKNRTKTKKVKKSVEDNENKQTSKNIKTKEDSSSDDDIIRPKTKKKASFIRTNDDVQTNSKLAKKRDSHSDDDSKPKNKKKKKRDDSSSSDEIISRKIRLNKSYYKSSK